VKTKELEPIKQGSEVFSTPMETIRQAISAGSDLTKLEKLMELQERYETNQARKAFAVAFSLVQSKISSIIKTQLNPQTHSKYASLDNILEIAKPVYTAEGFSMIFYEGATTVAENVRICADVLHKSGHKETYHIDIPCDGLGIKGSAFMTKTHAKASSTSYGRRYLTCMVWNIATSDEDGNAPAEKVNAEDVKNLDTLIVESEIELPKFLAFMKVEKLEDIAKSDLKKALNVIEAKRAGKK